MNLDFGGKTKTKMLNPNCVGLKTHPELYYADPDRYNAELDAYVVGCLVPDFPDQAYLRDRDLVLKARDAKEAVAKYIDKKHNQDQWLSRDEFRYVAVIAILAEEAKEGLYY